MRVAPSSFVLFIYFFSFFELIYLARFISDDRRLKVKITLGQRSRESLRPAASARPAIELNDNLEAAGADSISHCQSSCVASIESATSASMKTQWPKLRLVRSTAKIIKGDETLEFQQIGQLN